MIGSAAVGLLILRNRAILKHQAFLESLEELLCKTATYKTNIKIYSLERVSLYVMDFYFTLT